MFVLLQSDGSFARDNAGRLLEALTLAEAVSLLPMSPGSVVWDVESSRVIGRDELRVHRLASAFPEDR